MEEIKIFVGFIQGIGVVGILALLAFPKTRKWLGFDSSGITPEQLKAALTDNSAEHPALLARIPLLCTEQIKIREKIEKMAEDLSWVRGKLDS